MSKPVKKHTFAQFQSNSIDSSFDVPEIKAVFNMSDSQRKTSQAEQGNLLRGIVNSLDGARYVRYRKYIFFKLYTIGAPS